MNINKMTIKMMLIACFCVLSGCVSVSNSIPSTVDDIVKILNSPSTYEGKKITLRAWISMRHEDYNLWQTWQDHEDWRVKNCISLFNHFNTAVLRKSVDGKYVEIEGIFHMNADTNAKGKVVRLGSCNKFAIEFDGQNAIKILESN